MFYEFYVVVEQAILLIPLSIKVVEYRFYHSFDLIASRLRVALF